MVLFQFIPKSGIFGGFQLLGTPQVSKCTISTFSAEINNRKSCRQMRFSSSKYTECVCGRDSPPTPLVELTEHPDPLAAGRRGLAAPPENPTSVDGPWPQRSYASLH